MNENVMKVLWIGVSLLIFIGAVAIGMTIFSQGQDLARNSSDELSRTSAELMNSKYTMYDGTKVSGTSIISAIRSFRGDEGNIIIQVTTGNGTTYQYISSGTVAGDNVTGSLSARSNTSSDIASAKDSANTRYINPSGQFSASLAYDSNDVVRAIVFSQN